MKLLPLLLPALLLAACGEQGPETPASGDASASPSPALVARAEPLAVGDTAPAFAGLPDGGKTIVVFYRGPW